MPLRLHFCHNEKYLTRLSCEQKEDNADMDNIIVTQEKNLSITYVMRDNF